MSKTTLALIVGTRDFFPVEPVLQARREVIALLGELGVDVVIPPEDASNMGAVETWEDAKLWAQYFRQHRDDIDGILVSLPVFAPERGIADTIKLSELQVPARSPSATTCTSMAILLVLRTNTPSIRSMMSSAPICRTSSGCVAW